MKAIIMAGGFGTRLRPLTINLPKPMVPIGNLPIMEHVVSLLAKHGITDITSLLYFRPDDIRDYFGDGNEFGVSMRYCQPEEDYGTAGAVKYAIGDTDEPVIIISGDLITDFDLGEALTWHRERRSEATILMTRTENPVQFGIVITNPDGRIVRFMEKPSWGEAFSDTINTGIYILEPTATALIPEKENYDFSQNLYPLMLSKKMGLYGQVSSGYWKDVGNVGEYRNVHIDLLDGVFDLDLKTERVRTEHGVVYKKENTTIEDGVEISGTVVLGDEVIIEAGAKLFNCTVSDRTQIGPGSKIRNSVVWHDTHMGSRCEIDSSIICNNSRLGDNVKLNDNVIVSEDCKVGSDVTIKARCKVWPGKSIDEGAIVSSSIVWGDKWNKELFTDSKATGLALTEITTEMAVRLGTALGATLGQGGKVVTSRDASDVSRLLRRGLLSGMLEAGVHVSDLETMPIPVVRYALSKGTFSAGIYVRHNPLDYRQIDIILFDGSGLDMPNSKLKKIERNYFGEDYERATIENIGHLDQPQRVLENYRREFMAGIDSDLIRQAGFKVVIDHSNGASSAIFPDLFSRLGISSTELNAYLDPRKFSTTLEDQSRSIVQMAAIVKSLNADIGIILNSAAEKLTVVDDQGKPVDSQLLLLIVTELYVQIYRPRTIAVPVGASMGIDDIAKEYGTEVLRVSNDHRAMMDVRLQGKVDYVGGTRGGFLFPGFQMGADAILATVKILEMMARSKSRFSELRAKHDKYTRQETSIPCPWAKKGKVMRHLITGTDDKKRQLVDGVRVFENGGWVLIVPDRLKASFNVIAESESSEDTAALIERYRQFVRESQDE